MLTQPIANLILMALALSGAATADLAPPALKGVIFDERGRAVAGARVELFDKATTRTRTSVSAADGMFRFVLEPGGDYMVRIEAPGFEESRVPVTLAQAGAVSPMLFPLEPAGAYEKAEAAAYANGAGAEGKGGVPGARAGTHATPSAPAAEKPIESAELTGGAASASGAAAAKAVATARIGAFLVHGTIHDETGAVVAGAKLKLINTRASESQNSMSSETGSFQFQVHPESEYMLAVKAKGFQEAEVRFKTNQRAPAPLQVSLELAESRQEITVSAQSFNTPSATESLSAVGMDESMMRDLPQRNGDMLAIPSLFVLPSANGSMGTPKLMVDGVETDSVDLPSSGIKQVTIDQNPYSAEFSRPGRGRIDITTKRGSANRIRGNAMFLLRNSALDARNALATTNPLSQRGIFDGEVDGPISRAIRFMVSLRYDHLNDFTVVDAFTPAGNVIQNVPVPNRIINLLERTDFRFNSQHKATLTYKYKNKSLRNQGVGGSDLASHGTNSFEHENEIKAIDNSMPTSRMLNQFVLTARQVRQDVSNVLELPGIIVKDAFRSGAQADRRQQQSVVNAQDAASVIEGVHSLRFGFNAKLRFVRFDDEANFLGTFEFASLAAYQQNQPTIFTRNIGNPFVSFHHFEYGSFIQDEIRPRSDLSILLGVRHEAQNDVHHYTNFAPRFALAWSPGGRYTVVRAGGGIFYDRMPEVMEEHGLLYDGVRIRQIVVPNPPFPGDPSAGAIVIPSIERLDPRIRAPYVIQGTLGIDRKIGRGVLSIEGFTQRGVHLFRQQNLNAPLPGSGLVPNPAFLNINQFESAGTSRSSGVIVSLKAQVRHRMDIVAQYTLSRNLDDTNGPFFLPANQYDYRPEWGRADYDRLHRLNFIGTYHLPAEVRLGWVLNWWSGIPYNITTGFDTNQDTLTNDRPLGFWRNSGQGPGYFNADARLARDFRFGPESKYELRLGFDAFNFVNHVSYKRYVGTMTSPIFGGPNAAYPARALQTSVRFKF